MSLTGETLYVDLEGKLRDADSQGARELLTNAFNNHRNRYVNTHDLNRTFRFTREVIRLKDMNCLRNIFRRLYNSTASGKSEATPVIFIIERLSQWLIEQLQAGAHVDKSALPSLPCEALSKSTPSTLTEALEALCVNLEENGTNTSRQRNNTARLLTDMHNRAIDHLRTSAEMEPYVNFLNREYLRIILSMNQKDELAKLVDYNHTIGPRPRKMDRHINIPLSLSARWPEFGDLRGLLTRILHLRGFLVAREWRCVGLVLQNITRLTSGYNPYAVKSPPRRAQMLYCFILFYGSLAELYRISCANKLRIVALLRQYRCATELLGHSIPASAEIVHTFLNILPGSNNPEANEFAAEPTTAGIAETSAYGLPLVDPSAVDQTAFADHIILCSYMNLSKVPEEVDIHNMLRYSDPLIVLKTAIPSLARQAIIIMDGECIFDTEEEAQALSQAVNANSEKLSVSYQQAAELLHQASQDISVHGRVFSAPTPQAVELTKYTLAESAVEESMRWNENLETAEEEQLNLAEPHEESVTFNEYRIVPVAIDVERSQRPESYSTTTDLTINAQLFTATWTRGVPTVQADSVTYAGDALSKKLKKTVIFPLGWATCELLESQFNEYGRGPCRQYEPEDHLAAPKNETRFLPHLLPVPRGVPTCISVTLDGIPQGASERWNRCTLQVEMPFTRAAQLCVSFVRTYRTLSLRGVHSFIRAMGGTVSPIMLPSVLINHAIPFRISKDGILTMTAPGILRSGRLRHRRLVAVHQADWKFYLAGLASPTRHRRRKLTLRLLMKLASRRRANSHVTVSSRRMACPGLTYATVCLFACTHKGQVEEAPGRTWATVQVTAI